MKTLILASVICIASVVVAFAWTHGNGMVFIADNSSVTLTNDDGSENLLAQ